MFKKLRKNQCPHWFKSTFDRSPLICVDVGARGGMRENFLPFESFMEFDGFEPDEAACKKAQATAGANVNMFPIGLAEKTGTATLYVTNRPSGSSLYRPNYEIMGRYSTISTYGGIAKELEIDVLSYADFRKRYNRPAPHIVKLDTQGNELDILKSFSGEDWQEVLAIQTEVEFEPFYENQPLFRDVDDFLVSKGFALFDLRTARCYITKDDIADYYLKRELNFGIGRSDISARLVAGDALYIRTFDGSIPGDKDLCGKLLITYLTFGYYDYAFELAEIAKGKSVLTDEEYADLRRIIHKVAPRPKLWQRSGAFFDALRKKLRRARLYGPYRCFWMKRYWPNQ